MKGLTLYALAATVAVAGSTAACWPFLDGPQRTSLLVAALITVPLQVGLFALLLASGTDSLRFMRWWVSGMLGRMGVVAAVGLAASIVDVLSPTVLVMSTVGFFFVLLLLEPVFLPGGEKGADYAR